MASHLKRSATFEYESAVVATSGGTVTFDLTAAPTYEALGRSSRHWFAGLQFFSDADGNLPVLPTAGTAVFTVESPVIPDVFQALSNGTIDYGMANEQISFDSVATRIKVTIADIAPGTIGYFRMRAYGSPS